ncbi:MAG: hypothetical protein H6581_12165 [Bacteroidia bacterium]|nr:hypothetical protein [Bacteroidia bacterium]
MKEAETLYHQIGQSLADAEESQLFGKPCYKIGGKAFIAFFQQEMVFKLRGDLHHEALNQAGAQLFDPSGKKRPMKEWVQVPFASRHEWKRFAEGALEYVGRGEKKLI